MQYAHAVKILALSGAIALLGSCGGGGGNDFPEGTPGPQTGTPTAEQQQPAAQTPTAPLPVADPNTGDRVPPTVQMISPTDDQALRGPVDLIAGAQDAATGIAGVEFLINGERAHPGVVANSPYRYNFDTTLLRDGRYRFSARAYDGAGNRASADERPARVSNPSCKTASTEFEPWQNVDMPPQNGRFTIVWNATPLAPRANAVIGVARGDVGGHDDLATIVRFNEQGYIDARHAGRYTALASVPYVSGTRYRIGMEVDLATRTYSASVDGVEIAQNFPFRTEQNDINSAERWAVGTLSGRLHACLVSVVAAPPSTTPAPNTPPTANAGPDQSVAEGGAVALTGGGTDTDGTIASYAWAQIRGPAVTFANNTQSTSFTAPQVTTATQLEFRLTVQDNGGATGSDTAIVTVNDTAPATNSPPTANGGPDQTAT